MKQAEWYVDADTIGLGRVLAAAKLRVNWPGDDGIRQNPRDAVNPSPVMHTHMADDAWIPAVSRAGMAIITRDKMILRRTSEINAVAAANARMFALAVPENLNIWGLARLTAANWPEMERLAKEPGPFICNVSWTRVRQVWPESR